jgi:hypothetical protein
MYQILVFPKISFRTFRLCLGVLGYVMLHRRYKNSEVTFVPSKFIQPLSKKSRRDLIGYLIENKYISRFEPFDWDKDINEQIEEEYNRASYKKKPYFYLIHQKLRNLRSAYLDDISVEKTVTINLHNLYQQSFNHWAHNYRYIGIEVPNDEIWEQVINTRYHQLRINPYKPISLYIHNIKVAAQLNGNLTYKSYDLRMFGLEDDFGGRVSNIFTVSDPILRKYTTLRDAVEIGIKYSEGVLMADQLLRTIGSNDFTDYFIDKAVAYQEWVEKEKKKGKKVEIKQKSLELYTLPKDELILLGKPPITYYDIHREQIVNAMFGYSHNSFFSKMFPKTWDILFQIKANVVKEKENDKHAREYIFNQFVSNMNPKIFLNDWRIQIKSKYYTHRQYDEIIRRSQKYYKIVGLVWNLREVEVMRTIWKKLKSFGILCIPIIDKILVSGRFKDAVEKITIETWRKYLDPKIKIFSEVFNHY